jgi:hypothetical protein
MEFLMTICVEETAIRRTKSLSLFGLSRSFLFLVNRYRMWRTLSELEALPREVLKDIGWPSGCSNERLPAFWRGKDV